MVIVELKAKVYSTIMIAVTVALFALAVLVIR